MYTDSDNPYASPAIVVTPDVPPPNVVVLETEEERIRRLHLSVETSIRTLGALGYLLGGLWGVIAFSLVLQAFDQFPPVPNAFRMLAAAFLWCLVSAAFFAEGHALRKLNRLAGNVLAIAACLAIVAILGVIIWSGASALLIAVPVACYPIYLVRGKQGQMVLSQQYAKIRQQTPYMAYRPQAVKVTLRDVVLILLFILVMTMVMLLMR